MVAKTKQKRRGRETRKPRKIVLIGIEGRNRTERLYFQDLIRDKGDGYTVRFTSREETDPKGIAKSMIRDIKNYELDFTNGDLAYCVFDTDTDPDKQKYIDEAEVNAGKENIETILSNPCFEVWFLMHFTDSTHAFSNNREVIDRLKEKISDYEKNKSIYGSIKERTCTAVGNAKRLETFHDEMGRRPKHVDRNPSSEVYKIIEKVCKV